ncbi:glycosyltransferase [Trichocoleus sp. FACHB-262]|uniref:glycosyltransferase n=1 Tax=Trichocoleus sp. FACHB-262 TaxID=2692869 RepID=UPI001685BB3A|nr:glycosyltransferase [Trichocoleus sp. FACHB-262]MBD2121172.1 glycosyltransferase [Trichocoleus sp. FACHB-262]
MPLISVVIPAYNAEKTIEATIDSVLNQTFSDFELIVINDGSLDTTADIVSNIQDSRIKLISQPNSGPQKSRNRGICEAQGEYLAFLDADDLWTPDKLEAQLKSLRANPDAAVAYSWTNYINDTDQVIGRGSYRKATGNVYLDLLLLDFIGSGSNPLIKKQALLETQGFDESLVAGQDWDMWLRLASNYLFTVVPAPQVLYRHSSESWSSNIKRRESGFKQVIEKVLYEAPDSIRRYKKVIIANRYKCLTADTLQGNLNQRHGLMAAKFIGIAILNDPSLLKAKVLIKIFLKIFIILVFPASFSQAIISKFRDSLNVYALHGYLQLDLAKVD